MPRHELPQAGAYFVVTKPLEVMLSAETVNRVLFKFRCSSPRKPSPLSVDHCLDGIPYVIGVRGRSLRSRNSVRCFLIFCHVCAATYAVLDCYYQYRTTYTTHILGCVSCCAYVYICLHWTSIYLWRLRAGRLKRSKARLDGAMSISLSLLLSLAMAMCYNQATDPPDFWQEISLGTLIYVTGEITFFTCQLLNTVLFIEVALILSSEADRIARLVRIAKIHEKDCLRIASTCTRLSRTFFFPLNMLHTVYFLLLMTQIPVKVTRIATSEVTLYDKLHHARLLLEFLIIVRSGNRIVQNRRKLRKELKRRPEFFSPEVSEMQVFSKQDCGLTFLLGSSLSFKSFWDFVGFSWSFTLIVIQLSIDTGSSRG